MSKALIKLQTVYSRGVNFFGQLGQNNRYKACEHFTAVPGLEKVECKSINASYAQSTCLLSNGELLIWGWPLDVRSQMQIILLLNTNPRLAKFVQRYSPIPWISLREGKDFPQRESAALSGFEEVSIGGAFIVARDTDGRGYVWGNNHRGQCGTGDYGHRVKPTLASSLLDHYIVKAVAGYQHSLFLTLDGLVFGTGRIGNYAFGRVSTQLVTYKACILKFTQVNISGIKDMAAGQNHSLFINEEGKLYSVGKNEYGQCGQVSSMKYIEVPTHVQMPEKASMAACGTKHSLVLGESGKVYAFGCKVHGQIDSYRGGVLEEQNSPLVVEGPWVGKAVKVVAGFDRSAVILENGEVWTWGGVDYRYLEGEYYDTFTLVNALMPQQRQEDITEISLGYMHTLIMTSSP